MPSNHLLINNSIEYTVPDSKMDDFLEWLDRNGHAVKTCLGNPPGTIVDETNKPGVISQSVYPLQGGDHFETKSLSSAKRVVSPALLYMGAPISLDTWHFIMVI